MSGINLWCSWWVNDTWRTYLLFLISNSLRWLQIPIVHQVLNGFMKLEHWSSCFRCTQATFASLTLHMVDSIACIMYSFGTQRTYSNLNHWHQGYYTHIWVICQPPLGWLWDALIKTPKLIYKIWTLQKPASMLYCFSRKEITWH